MLQLAFAAFLATVPVPAAHATTLRTPSGVTFSVLGAKPARPAPTLFVFAADRVGALESDEFNACGKVLQRTVGCLCVSLDMPAHGDDRVAGTPSGLDGWRYRLDRKQDIVTPLLLQTKAVLDYLIREGWTDARRVAIAGNSRGGYMALQAAGAEPRFGAVALFSPVTELTVLKEFKGLPDQPLAQSAAVPHLVEHLAGRPIWICIGNADPRVGTRQAIAFYLALVAAAQHAGRPAPAELHVMESEGHHTPAAASDLAAAWLGEKLSAP